MTVRRPVPSAWQLNDIDLATGRSTIATALIRFGRFEWCAAPAQLSLEGRPVDIGARAALVLAFLIAERHRTVDKSELLARAWPDRTAHEHNLHAQVSALRAVLGPDAIATVPGRGYRFTAAVEALPSAQPATALGMATSAQPALPADTAAAAREPPTRRLAAILQAAVVDGRDDTRAEPAQNDVHQRLATHALALGGQLAATSGGSFTARFGSALEAVRCALDVQRETAAQLARHPPSERAGLQIGVHVGDVIQQGEAVYGDVVWLASLLQRRASAGETCVSGHVLDQVEGHLEVSVRYAGDQTGPGLARPLATYLLTPAASAMPAPIRPVRFGRCELQVDHRVLLIDGQPARVGARAFDVLVALFERRDRMVPKGELLEVVWPHAVVEEGNLQTQVSNLRKLLGADVLQTIPGRGYRFAAPLIGEPASPQPAPRFSAADAVAPPVSPGEALTGSLPEVLPPLLGREDELATLSTWLMEHRLVTLVAAGGMGKSRLAQHVLHGLRNAYAHGVCLVELAGISEAGLVVATVASALGTRVTGDDALPGLVTALRPREMLIVLDNAEHLIEEVARVAQAVAEGAPNVRLLVTSQASLKVGSEKVFRLGALAVPDHPTSAEQALTYGAVALFNARASAADRTFTLDAPRLAAVLAICRQLDGMPLAIELAAARVRMLGVHKLAAALEQRLKLLTGDLRSLAARHKTLRAALDWSHSLLTQAEQVTFRRLAVFAGSFSLEMAQQVVADAAEGEQALDEWAVLDTLGSLVDRSLVTLDEGDPGAAPRYRLLETPRAYASEKLGAYPAEQRLTRKRHAEAVLRHFRAVDDRIWSGRSPVDDCLPAFEPDLDNARVALEWSLGNDAAAATRLVTVLEHGMRLSRWSEYAQWWAATEPLIDALTDSDAAARWRLAFSRCWGDVEPERAMAHARLAADHFDGVHDARGWYLAEAAYIGAAACAPEAVVHLDRLDQLLAREDATWPAYVRLHGARVALLPPFRRGDIAGAKAGTDMFVRLARAAGTRARVLGAQANLADLALALGQTEASIRANRTLLGQCLPVKDNYWLTQIWTNLFDAHVEQDQLEQAREAATQAWPLVLELNRIQWWLDSAAHLAAREGRVRQAARLVGASDARYALLRVFRQRNGIRCIAAAEARVRERLAEAEVDALKREGAMLSIDEILALGLSRTDDD